MHILKNTLLTFPILLCLISIDLLCNKILSKTCLFLVSILSYYHDLLTHPGQFYAPLFCWPLSVNATVICKLSNTKVTWPSTSFHLLEVFPDTTLCQYSFYHTSYCFSVPRQFLIIYSTSSASFSRYTYFSNNQFCGFIIFLYSDDLQISWLLPITFFPLLQKPVPLLAVHM